MAKKKSNINKYTNGLEINEIYSKISRGSSFIPGVIDESKLTSRVVKKDETFKARPFEKNLESIRPVLSSGFSNRGNFRTNYTPPAPAPTFAFGNALSFDGINDDVTFTNSIDKPAPISGFSFSMWVKFDSALANEWILGSSVSANNWFRIDSTAVIFRSRSSGAATTIWSVPAFSTGTWYHIAVSLVNTVNELWINGTKYTGDADNYDNENLSFNKIGIAAGSYYGQFVIDEFAMQSGAGLSQADVDALYNGGNGALATDVMTPDIYYKLNGSGADITATDSSGNGNTGALNNFTGTYWVTH